MNLSLIDIQSINKEEGKFLTDLFMEQNLGVKKRLLYFKISSSFSWSQVKMKYGVEAMERCASLHKKYQASFIPKLPGKPFKYANGEEVDVSHLGKCVVISKDHIRLKNGKIFNFYGLRIKNNNGLPPFYQNRTFHAIEETINPEKNKPKFEYDSEYKGKAEMGTVRIKTKDA